MWKTSIVAKRSLLAVLLMVATTQSIIATPNIDHEITEKEAIATAEKFVVDGGYTTKKVSNYSHEQEAIDGSEAWELKLRCNTLEPRAYACVPFHQKDKRWAVIFRFSEEQRTRFERRGGNLDDRGRAVTMDKFGESVTIEHVDFSLPAVDRVTRDPINSKRSLRKSTNFLHPAGQV